MTSPLISQEDPNTGTEFGGVGGLIQPPPHEPTPSERLSIMVNIDPQDIEIFVDVE